MRNATENLSETDRAWIIAPRDAGDLTRLLVDLQSSSRKSVFSNLLSRLEPFTRLLKSFTQIITVFVSANPVIAAPVWGTVMVLIEVHLLAHLDETAFQLTLEARVSICFNN